MVVSEQVAPTASKRTGRRQRVFSGMQPTGNVHLGNYLGAIRNWVTQQDQYDNVFSIVDLHALSAVAGSDAETLRSATITLASAFLAAGIDPERSILFAQSDVREHTELCWILSAATQYGELRRMIQFKEKSQQSARGEDGVSAALFFYPVLQAADILLYDADLVPVGDDQRQHVELTRDIAERFNRRFGETFVVPKADIKEIGARIMALDDPTAKMSKSSPNPGSYIALTDEPDAIRKKIRRAVTDSGSEVRADPDRPAMSNLLGIYSLFSNEPVSVIQDRFVGKGYGDFKKELAEVVVNAIEPIQIRLKELTANPEIVIDVLDQGAERARVIAAKKMEAVRERIGIGH